MQIHQKLSFSIRYAISEVTAGRVIDLRQPVSV
jgi:hypothetical protein